MKKEKEIYSVIIDTDERTLQCLTKEQSSHYRSSIQKKVISKKWLKSVKDALKKGENVCKIYDQAEWVGTDEIVIKRKDKKDRKMVYVISTYPEIEPIIELCENTYPLKTSFGYIFTARYPVSETTKNILNIESPCHIYDIWDEAKQALLNKAYIKARNLKDSVEIAEQLVKTIIEMEKPFVRDGNEGCKFTKKMGFNNKKDK